ncbi:MAG TPA: class I SAM-dependent methyltransferase [Terriglobales bacterium]
MKTAVDFELNPEVRRQPDQSALHNPAACPVCGQIETTPWLSGHDYFHGRAENYSLVRCTNCSLVWLQNPPLPAEMDRHYTDAYHRLISAAGDAHSRWAFRKEALEPHKQSGSLLDLGCSSGAFLSFMRGDAWKLYGIEMSHENARLAEQRSHAQIFVGDILEAPFPQNSFDVITCFDVLEHVYQPRQVIERVSHWLKPGGLFYVLVPNIDSAEARVFGRYWHGLELPRHLSHFSPASLTFLANSVGLQTASLETHRNPAVGTSLRYVGDDMFAAIGIRRTPVAYRSEPGIAWRAARKVVRMTLLRMLLAMAPVAGQGESIHAIFQKAPSA